MVLRRSTSQTALYVARTRWSPYTTLTSLRSSSAATKGLQWIQQDADTLKETSFTLLGTSSKTVPWRQRPILPFTRDHSSLASRKNHPQDGIVAKTYHASSKFAEGDILLVIPPRARENGSLLHTTGEPSPSLYERLNEGLLSSWSPPATAPRAAVKPSFRRPPSVSSPNAFDKEGTAPRGMGLFAVENIQNGDVILQELPTLLFAYPDPKLGLTNLEFRAELARLCATRLQKATLDQLASLSRVGGTALSADGNEDFAWIEEVIETNGILLEMIEESREDESSEVGSVIQTVSRCNHSCSPNAYLVFDAGTGYASLVATSFIPEGEEITLSYVDVLAPREERNAALQSKWKFSCDCPSCTLPASKSAISDARREQIKNWFSDTPTRHNHSNPNLTAASISLKSPSLTSHLLQSTIIPSAETFVRFCDEEGELQIDLSYTTKERMALAYALLGNHEHFDYWAKRARDQLRGFVSANASLVEVGLPKLKNNISLKLWDAMIESPVTSIARWGEHRS